MFPIQGEIAMNNDSMSDMVPLEIGKDFKLPDTEERSRSPQEVSLSDEGNNGFYLSDYDNHNQDDENTFSRTMQMMRRKKNRLAAQKCREKKKERIRILEQEIKSLIKENYNLKQTNFELEEKLVEQEKKLQDVQSCISPDDHSHHLEDTYQLYHNKQQILTPPNIQNKHTIKDNDSLGHYRNHNSMAPSNFYNSFINSL